MEADKIKMLQARIPEKEKQVKQLKPDKKELHKIEQQVKVNFEAIFERFWWNFDENDFDELKLMP